MELVKIYVYIFAAAHQYHEGCFNQRYFHPIKAVSNLGAIDVKTWPKIALDLHTMQLNGVAHVIQLWPRHGLFTTPIN
jgi:hypothetical protein